MPDLGLGEVLTAIVTPFDENGAVNEEAFVALMAYLGGAWLGRLCGGRDHGRGGDDHR